SENAAWESDLPTSPGASLMAGSLDLKTGVATIRFLSGAELVVEAPARLELFSTMRAKLYWGAAMVDVPDSAIGFVLETPGSYAVDFGTKFAVRVDENQDRSDFELIEGIIEVHHSDTGESVKLHEAGLGVQVDGEQLALVDPSSEESDGTPEREVRSDDRLVRIGTNGRCGTAMPRSHKRSKFIDPEVLSVKKSNAGTWDFESFFEFDFSQVAGDQIEEARLRLNLVPSYRGHASRLPEVCRFAVYGLTDPDKANWKIETTWEDAPHPEDGVLLGNFDVLRSQQRGTFGISTPELLEFIRKGREQPMTFILVRETKKGEAIHVEGVGAPLTHMFASDKHPESVGPLLELRVR
ncbi:MAG: iron dicitrate transport regulator FecR, partial [Planctomycetota bacterium]